MQLMSKNQGWNPTEIVDFTRGGGDGSQQIDAYDAEKGNAMRWSKGYGDKAGPDSPSGEVSVGPNETNGINFGDERPPLSGTKHSNPYPGKPL